MKKLLLSAIVVNGIFLSSIQWVEAAYPKVDCAIDATFNQYSCNECFDGSEIKNGATISFLDDVWVNNSDNRKIFYKEEQSLPRMNALNGASFEQNPASDEEFWEYTSELETMYSPDYDGYVLQPGQEVSWIKSTLGSAYRANTAGNVRGVNVGLLVFDLMSHNILPNNEMAMNDRPHKECVLFKAAQAEEIPVEPTPIPEPTPTPPAPEEMTQVQTGPELYFVALILSLLIGMVWVNRKTLFVKK